MLISPRSRTAAALITVAAITLAACSGGRSPSSSPETTTTVQPPESSAPPASVPAVEVQLQKVAQASSPIAMAVRSGTAGVYIAERGGRVRPLDLDTGQIAAPIIDISADVSTGGERGLLGLTFSPDGARLYLSYTNRAGDTRVDEYEMDGATAKSSTKRTLLAVEQPAPNHNGGDIAFGPDGMLWFGLGDGGGAGDPQRNAQNTQTLLGSIVRVDPSRRDAGEYGIPPDNPFVDGGGRPEIWLYGVRNPWRFSFDRSTGDLWIGDVGQNEVEEIDFLPSPDRGRGANLQWPLKEGFRSFSGDAPSGSTDPIFEYGRDDGSCSITGGFVYRGSAIAELRGAYVYGDYCEGSVRALFGGTSGFAANAGAQQQFLGANAGKGNLASFGQDADGELYTLGLDGTISRIVATSPAAATTTVTSPGAASAPNGRRRPAPPTDAATTAREIQLTEEALRDPATSQVERSELGHRNQVAYRTLGLNAGWDQAVFAALPAGLVDVARAHVDARRALAAMHPNPSDNVPAWQIIEPEPVESLLGYYREAEAATGIGWEYLAAINLVETGFGRIHGLSVAGAQGPMQFLPTTWAERGIGAGDIDDPHDAIAAAARYLVRRGGPANMAQALHGYNNSANYVKAVSIYADLMRRDERALWVLHAWEIHYLSSAGDLWLPVGYLEGEPAAATDYLTRSPWSAPAPK